MVKLKKTLWMLWSCIILFGWWTTTAQAAPDKPYVFVISINGLKASDLSSGGLPNLTKLKANGVYYPNLSGLDRPDQNILTILGQKDDSLLLPNHLAHQNIATLLLDSTDHLPETLLKNNNVKPVISESITRLFDLFVNEFEKNDYHFVVFDFHKQISNDQRTNSALSWSQLDNQVGRLLNYLINQNILEKSTLIITANSDQPFVILFRLKQNLAAQYYHCNLSDITPTICEVFGQKPPASINGNVLYEFFYPPTETGVQKRIIELQRESLAAQRDIALLQEENRLLDTSNAAIEQERGKFNAAISARDQHISRLELHIKLQKALGFIILLLFLAGLIIEYRILRKKFLMFP